MSGEGRSHCTDLNQKYVLALDKNNALEYRIVKTGPHEGWFTRDPRRTA